MAHFMRINSETPLHVARAIATNMKKALFLAFTTVLSMNLLAADPTASPADAKWLGAIEKMVAAGHYDISTPVAQRAQLLSDWAKKHGYAVQLTKTDTTIRIKLAKDIAKN